MKNTAKKATALIKAAAIMWGGWFCMTKSTAASEAVSSASERCLTAVIPSLYAMMIVSGLMIRTGLIQCAARYTSRAGRLIFGMEGEVSAVFLFSMFAGYPVGARMIGQLYDSGRLSKRRAELFCGVCYGAGPAFVQGCIAQRLYGSQAVGRTIVISTVAANIVLALGLSLFVRRDASDNAPAKAACSKDVLTDCILSAGRSMAEICFMITAFAVAAAMLDDSGVFAVLGDRYAAIARTLLDVTAVEELPRRDYTLIPLLSGIVSFGGICVICQAAAMNSGRLNAAPMIIMRVISGIISYFVCRLIMPYTLRGETVAAASSHISLHSKPSPIPSVMLILMTFMLLRKDRASDNKMNSCHEVKKVV